MLKSLPISTQNFLIKQLPKATVFVNERLEVVYASDKWIADFKLEPSDIFGKYIGDLFTRTGRDWENALRDCLSGSADETTVHLSPAATPNDTWFEWTCVPWKNQEGQIIGLIIETEDITQRKREEVQNNKLRTLLKATCEIGKIGCWEYSFDKDELSWCCMTREIHGVSDDYVPTVDSAVQFYKDGHSRNTIAMLIHRATEYGERWNEKLQIVDAHGNEIWVLSAGMPNFKDGELIGFMGTFQNIDEQVKSETKTKESEHLLRTLVDNLPLHVYIKDTESRKILVNKAECTYLGASDPKELLGKSDFELYDPESAQRYRNDDLRVMETSNPILAQESIITKKDGEKTTFLISKIPLADDDGKVTGLVGISMDISELKQKEEELRDLVNVVSSQNKKLIQFAHIVSHNLRSHTANFSMLLEFLAEETNESEKTKIVDMLSSSSDRLMETLENLNEIIVINTNSNLDKKPVSLKTEIKKIQGRLSSFLEENRVELAVRVSHKDTIHGIPEYIESILTNLITNAVRFKHPDRDPFIKITTKRENDYMILSITDNGLGIDLEKYGNKVFGMYKTFHDRSDAKGLGLFISKNQIEAMNGKIEVESNLGTGSTFMLYFDAKNQ
ncbi:PAS domain-containing protein [Pricia sp. S334]|uniref:histidine kinase n=1 Tax=Pricia mediterranea TaxID=3076079 RepID=A0ABU3L9A7_9FLAO|nr:PAS domain-containing protein [Pricia sp. S334]MDT7829662.1 PAS domain-containing protein [Pricia sp. S334]